MPRVNLHAKFLILILGGLVVLLGTLSIALVQREEGILARKADEKQHVLAFTILSDLKQSMLTGAPRSTLELMDSIRGTYGLVRLQVVRDDGSPAFGITGGRLALPQIDQTFKTGEEISFLENDKIPLHTILYPLKNEGQCNRCHGNRKNILGVLLVSLSQEDTNREMQESKKNLIFSLAVLILLVGGMLYAAIRKVILSPLSILHDGAERIGRGEFSHRIRLSTDDEIQHLAQTFNAMAGRLEESRAGLEQKVAERTVQLSLTMAELKDKADRLYAYSRDLATISRLSTKVFNAEQDIEELLDRFMHAISHGLGFDRALLSLVDRKRVWLDVKRDSGLGKMLSIESQSLAGTGPFAALVRGAKDRFIDDVTRDPSFRPYLREGTAEECSLYLIPVLTGTRNKKCWQEKNCIRDTCPAYKGEESRCWLVDNTLCGNALIESYGDKLAYCMTCDVFPVLGVLVVAAPQGKTFRKHDVSVLRVLAAEMGAALDNHRLYGDNRKLVRELLELHKVTAAVLSELSLDRALEAFTDSALKFSGLDACCFWLRSDDGRELLLKASGRPGALPDSRLFPERLPADKGALGEAFSHNRVVTDYQTTFDGPETEKGTAAREFPSLLAIPLRAESRPLGVFSVHKKSTAPFLDAEIAAFMLLANHAAIAINVCMLNEELKKQNQELAKSTGLLGGILASMSSGVALLASSGTVKLINLQGAQILRCRREEVLGKKLSDLFPEAKAFWSSAPGRYREIEFSMPDGNHLPVGFSSTFYLGDRGINQDVIVTFQDLTEIRALQAQVLGKERFAAMGRVVAGVAHEIRNPLFGISSISQIFERELKDPAHVELARALLSETKRLNQLVEELLIYGRPIKLTLGRCDLVGLWEEVIGMHRDEIEKKAITISGDLAMGHTPAYLDAYQIRQVFLNLIRNAIEATPQGGEIMIRLLLEDQFIIFKLADTGSGMPAENIARAFELFFTTKSKGTGLGLAICKKIVEDHGGEISIESRERDWLDERKGTTVTVKLPYRGITDRNEALVNSRA